MSQDSSCRLCGAPATDFPLPRGSSFVVYGRCRICGFTGVAAPYFPDAESERERYLLHRNDLGDPGYRRYLDSFVERAILPYADPALPLLDFGSGPEPSLSSLLSRRGFSVTSFDPFFSPAPAWEKRRYGCIVLHEVAEHLRFPREVLDALAELLLPGGTFALRTRFLPAQESDFAAWWYRQDPTHLGFFAKTSLEYFFLSRKFEILLSLDPDLVVARRTS